MLCGKFKTVYFVLLIRGLYSVYQKDYIWAIDKTTDPTVILVVLFDTHCTDKRNFLKTKWPEVMEFKGSTESERAVHDWRGINFNYLISVVFLGTCQF